MICDDYKPPAGSKYVGHRYGVGDLQALLLPTIEPVSADVTNFEGVKHSYIMEKEHDQPSRYIKALASQAGVLPSWLKPAHLSACRGVDRRGKWLDARFQHKANGYSMPMSKGGKNVVYPTRSSLMVRIRLTTEPLTLGSTKFMISIEQENLGVMNAPISRAPVNVGFAGHSV